MRSRNGATATTGPNKGNGCATRANRVETTAIKPLFCECFARVARHCIEAAIAAKLDPGIQFRKTRRGNCW
jgi:hypothetical protein